MTQGKKNMSEIAEVQQLIENCLNLKKKNGNTMNTTCLLQFFTGN